MADIKTPLRPEEKTEINKQRYLKLIERCRNNEYITRAERTTQDITEEKKAAIAACKKITRANYNNRHRAEINEYMNNFMKDKYKNNEAFRVREREQAKLRYRKRIERLRLEALAKDTVINTEDNISG
jgi:acetyl-CoA carboxylase beta subunit